MAGAALVFKAVKHHIEDKKQPFIAVKRKSPRKGGAGNLRVEPMKIKNSLKSLAKRHRDNRVVRRRGRLYVINKTNRRFKARQG